MDVELLEIRDFLALHPPFDGLPDEVLDRLPREMSVRYLRRGTSFPPADAQGHFLYMVRSGAIELRDARDELLDKFAEGDVYAEDCGTIRAEESRSHATTTEDTLCYLLPCARAQQLRDRFPRFNNYFEDSIRERLRHALESLYDSCSSGFGLMAVEVGSLVARPPVQIGPNVTLQQAAKLMLHERISALLVMEEHRLIGILTDRDLRRCVAEGLPYETPVDGVMTRKLHKVTAETSAFEALITMSRLNVHHLPVMDRAGLAGLISTTDLVRYQSANAVFMVGDVRAGDSVEALAQIAHRLPELQVQIVASGATAYQLGQAVSSVADALTTRLIELAEARLGPPPVAYAWLAGGSQARREQTVHSDQDNALLFADDASPEHEVYFSALAQFVNDGLDACGFRYCPGEVMARNPKWRQPLRVWQEYFRQWITHADRKSAMLAINFIDMRVIHGEESLHDRLHAEVIKAARNNQVFLAYVASNALANRPPLGFFRHLVLIGEGDHSKALDIKHRAIIPITDLARVHALSAGLPEIGTVDRLRAAAEAGTISPEGAADLEDAFEFITTLRARHQARQIKRGEAPDNYVNPGELAPIERSHLKDVFGVIRGMQNTLAQRSQAGRLY